MFDSPHTLVFLLWLIGGFVSGVSGIGGAMVAVPAAAMFIPMQELVPLACLLNVIMDGSIAAMHFRHCRWSALKPLLVGSVPGAFAGLYILTFVSSSILQGAVGALLIYYVYWQLTFKVEKTHPESWSRGSAAGSGQPARHRHILDGRPSEHTDSTLAGSRAYSSAPSAYSS